MNLFKNPMFQAVLTVVVVVAVLKAFGDKIPVIGKYVSLK